MFTGLVQSLAEVAEVVAEPPGVRLVIREAQVAATASVGDSIALNGCCLTVVAVDGELLRSKPARKPCHGPTWANWRRRLVNVETSLRAGDPLGGHYVTGHIDAVGTVHARHDDGDWCTMWFQAPAAQLAQMASKGSIAVDGVSLTLVDVEDDRFSVALIPHTLEVTTLGRRKVGDRVNLETDVLAKYVAAATKSPRSHAPRW